MSDIPVPTENTQKLPDLDKKQFNYWKDWSYNLQLAHTDIPGLEGADHFGHAMNVISSRTVQELRESRKKGGRPYIILTDEEPDEEVVAKASQNDLEKAFTDATFKQLRGWFYGESESEKQYYPVAAVALGSALLEQTPEETKELILKNMDEADIIPLQKDLFTKALAKIDFKDVDKLREYLQFSQTQMTNNETYFIQTGRKEPPRIGSEPLNIGGNTYTFENEHPTGIALETEDENILTSLMAANHRSRADMIEQAKKAANQLFDLRGKKISDPPKWWKEGDHLNGISSKDVLIFVPYSAQVDEENLPKIYNVILKSSRNRGGWFLTQVEKQDGSWIMTGEVDRLIN